MNVCSRVNAAFADGAGAGEDVTAAFVFPLKSTMLSVHFVPPWRVPLLRVLNKKLGKLLRHKDIDNLPENQTD